MTVRVSNKYLFAVIAPPFRNIAIMLNITLADVTLAVTFCGADSECSAHDIWSGRLSSPS